MLLELNNEYLEVLKNILEVLTSNKDTKKIRKNFNLKDKDGNTPLDLAIMVGSSNAVKLLLGHGAEIKKNKQKTNALHNCSRYNINIKHIQSISF